MLSRCASLFAGVISFCIACLQFHVGQIVRLPKEKLGDTPNHASSSNGLRMMTPYPYRNVQSGHAEGLTLTSRHVVVIGVGHREAIITWLRICIMRVDLYCRCAGYRAALPSSLTIRCHYASGNECVLAAVLTRPSRLASAYCVGNEWLHCLVGRHAFGGIISLYGSGSFGGAVWCSGCVLSHSVLSSCGRSRFGGLCRRAHCMSGFYLCAWRR